MRQSTGVEWGKASPTLICGSLSFQKINQLLELVSVGCMIVSSTFKDKTTGRWLKLLTIITNVKDLWCEYDIEVLILLAGIRFFRSLKSMSSALFHLDLLVDQKKKSYFLHSKKLVNTFN